VKKAYLQVYTGDGKGKTTAALGLTLRAVGAGMRVFIGQFAKSGRYSEIAGLERLGDRVTVRQYGDGRFIKGLPSAGNVRRTADGLTEATAAMASGEYDLVILDEANVAVTCGLFEVQTLLTALAARHPKTEVVVTGRGAHPLVIEAADLVTEMREVKHYYRAGVKARKGIEV